VRRVAAAINRLGFGNSAVGHVKSLHPQRLLFTRDFAHNDVMKPIQVYLASDPVNAEIAKDFLGSFGIVAHVRSQYLWGGMGQLPVDVYPSVWVDDGADYDRACELIQRFETGAIGGRPWDCPQCGERLGGPFDECWRCGTPRPE